MSESSDGNEGPTRAGGKFFDLNISNWENLTYEQRMQIADNIYSGFLRSAQVDKIQKPIPSNDVQKKD